MNNKQQKLLLFAPAIVAVMFVLVPVLTNLLGRTLGITFVFLVYWFVFCLFGSMHISGGFKALSGIYAKEASVAVGKIYYAISVMPCLAAFVIFLVYAPGTSVTVLIAALLLSVVNGVMEELFWRGTFNKIFQSNIIFAYVYSTLFFGIWHFSLLMAKGIKYPEGAVLLVGGGFAIGIIWGFVVFKTKSIKLVMCSHIITNFFYYTGYIIINWFK